MYIKYLRQLLYFSAGTAVVSLILSFMLPRIYITSALPFLIVFFTAASLISFYFLLKTTGKRFIKFVNVFLLTIVLKLFLYGGVMIIYALLNRSDAIPFLISFFILYLLFTIFETVFIARLGRN